MKPLRLPAPVGLALLLAGVAACYWGVLRNGFVWDDRITFLDIPQLMSWAGLKQALAHPSLFFPPNYYRPLTTILTAAELAAGGRAAWLLHADSLLIHLANTALVYWLARSLAARLAPGGARLAWLAAALYGFHPALIEPVTWIAARSDLTVTFFVLACMILSYARERAGRLPLLALAYFCAGLSKESAVVLPVLLLLTDGFLARRTQLSFAQLVRSRYRDYCAVLLAGLAVLAVRYMGLGYLMSASGRAPATGTTLQHALLVGQALFAFLRAALLPFDTINPFHPVAIPAPLADPRVWAQALAALAAVAVFAHGWWRGREWGLMGLLYAAALLPVLQIIPLPLSGNLYHDRYMTLPLAFAALGAASVATTLAAAHRGALAAWGLRFVLACWIAAAAANIVVTVPLWRSDAVLWKWVLERNPGSFIAEYNLAAAYLTEGRYARAARLNLDLLRRYPGHYLPLLNLGLEAIRQGHFDEATRYFERAIKSPYGIKKSYYVLALGNLGYAEARRGNIKLAATLLSEAVRLAPAFVKAIAYLSLVERVQGNTAAADANWARALTYVSPRERPAFTAHAQFNLQAFRNARRQRAHPEPGKP